jgi:acyl-CoA synthetase (AMP-forming)/AMP-acid ligase II
MRAIDFFDRGVALNPERACLKDASVTRSYREVQARSCRIANALRREGLKPEDKAAVYSPNSAVAFECVLGILRAAAAWVPINARNVVAENAFILDHCDVEALFYYSEFEANVREIRRQCPKLRIFVCIDKAGENGPYLEEWLNGVDDTDPNIPERRDALSAIYSTGGTTGRPKGVMWSHLTWETMISSFHLCMPVKRPPVHLVVAPMTHAAGAVAMILMAVGATQIILPQFDAELVMNTIQRERVTHMFLPPTAIYMLLAHPDVRKYDYSSLDYFLYLSAPMSVEKLKECLRVFGPVMTQSFGQVEAPMMCTYFPPEDHVVAMYTMKEQRLASCGKPTMLVPVAIMDDKGNILSPGQRGEIVVRGNLVMMGYYKNPAATAEASAFGWHHTGDVGYMDEDGYVYLVDRKKDMIISGGFNIFASEVEQAIFTHPAVQDCAVIGVPDEKWGEAVKAVVQLKAGQRASEEEIIALCKQKVGSVKAPKSVEFWESLPRSPVGKVRKKDIRERFWTGRSRAI